MTPVYPRDTDSPFPRQSEQDLTALTYVFYLFIAAVFVFSLAIALLLRWLFGC